MTVGDLPDLMVEFKSLVHAPQNLSFEEAATLPCAGLTAYNALTGLVPVKPGDTVLVQGTGGVSMFVIGFSPAIGGAH